MALAEAGRVQYDPYGEVLTSTLPVTLTDRLFTGARFDSTTGLYQMGARWYDPALGRWIQPDTLVPDPLNPQAWNRFSYVYNNPTSYVDPGGHIPIDWLLDIGGLAFDIYQIRQDPSLANWGWLALDVGLWVLPFVPAAAGALAHADEAAKLARAAGRMEDAGDARRIVEIGSGGGENLLRIAEARPTGLIVGVDYADEAVTLARTRAGYSPYRNIEIVRANYLEAPFRMGQFDEVIAIAPGSTKGFVVDAAKVATEMVSTKGYIYIVTDLGATPEAIKVVEQGLSSRGLRGQIVSGFRSVGDIARGRNPLGIPLRSDFFGGYQEVWEIFVRLGP